MRDDIFSKNSGIINLRPSKGKHSVCFFGNYYFDSYGCAPPKIEPNYIKSKHDKSVYSEYEIQRNNNLCGSFCLYNLYCMVYFRKILKQLF